jgi:hypothetical protein
VRFPWDDDGSVLIVACGGLAISVAGIAMVVLAWRRSFPIGVAVWVVATNVAINPENQFTTLLSLVLVSYTVGSETEPPRSYAGLGVVVLPFLAVSVAEGSSAGRPPVSVVADYAAFPFSGVMWWGCAITAVCFTVFAVAVERATRPTGA